jgi:NitT/TauT family transport system permease protein
MVSAEPSRSPPPSWTASLSNEAPAPSRARKIRTSAWARGLVGITAFLLLAEALGRSGAISQSVLPLASTVLARAAGLAGNARFLGDLAATIEAWAAGLGITVAVAVPCGVVLGSVPVVRMATRAVVEFLRPIPSVALIPLAALILGPGLRMNLTLIVYAAIWPVLFNTIYGLDDVDPVAKETLRAFGFGRLAVIRRVSLPAAAPFIVTGIQLASSIAIILNIGTGILTGRIDGNGIGAFIADTNSGAGNTALVLAAALWAGALGLALNSLLAWARRRALPWHHGYLGDPG